MAERKLAYPMKLTQGQVIPEVHIKWLYDFVGGRQQATAQFTGGGAAFATNGFDPPQSSINVGAKLTMVSRANLAVSLNYDLERKTDFTSHS